MADEGTAGRHSDMPGKHDDSSPQPLLPTLSRGTAADRQSNMQSEHDDSLPPPLPPPPPHGAAAAMANGVSAWLLAPPSPSYGVHLPWSAFLPRVPS